jgi:hypothetical protein
MEAGERLAECVKGPGLAAPSKPAHRRFAKGRKEQADSSQLCVCVLW